MGTSECPFCVMMRKGGCEAPFVAFMECGERAEKDSAGGNKFKDCVEYFDALQVRAVPSPCCASRLLDALQSGFLS